MIFARCSRETIGSTRSVTGQLTGLVALALLSACNRDDSGQMPDANRTRTVVENGGAEARLTVKTGKDSATPMAEREAVIGLLNKRNGLTRDLKMKPGQALRVGDVIVRLRACEVTAPWENVPETGAFVQLDVRSAKDDKWRRVFSGWLFKDRPERNVVEHPIYDVWVKSCAMAWPETGPETVKVGDKGAIGSASGASAGDKSSNASEALAPAPSANNTPSSASGTSATAADSNAR